MVDWHEYHKKRQHELGTFLKAAKMALSRVGPPRPEPAGPGARGRGRPPYSPGSMLLLNLLRIQLKMSYRDLESLLRANAGLRDQLGLAHVPGRDTIHRHAQTLREAYLHRFNDEVTQRLKKTSYAGASTRPASRSKHTRDVGALPRTPTVATNAG